MKKFSSEEVLMNSRYADLAVLFYKKMANFPDKKLYNSIIDC